ncbi:Protein tweety like [Actinidia chinensis var. chinensis]|uniref:Protein tweety like n=1 Tax=Actinidia chinensis var. chinensis TaxID=1590841 RepID=A0A2R6QHT5_ACTCC|nr:Protein tweety like [Actinidia chinensis var. chinensis]
MKKQQFVAVGGSGQNQGKQPIEVGRGRGGVTRLGRGVVLRRGRGSMVGMPPPPITGQWWGGMTTAPEDVDEREIGVGVVIKWNERRFLDENSKNSTTLILAANRTHRRDPKDGFKFYTGGWNITNEHYLYSVTFSAAPLFLIAVVWFLLFGICLCCMCLRGCCCCCRREKPYGYTRHAYALSLSLVIIFTIATIAGSAFLYSGQEEFQNSTVNVFSYILKQADTIVHNLREIFNYLLGAKKIGVGEVVLPPDLVTKIDQMQGQINGVADHLLNITGKSSAVIRHVTDPVRLVLLYVTAAMVLLACLGFIFSILGLQCFVYFLMIIGWIAVVGTLILSGLFLFVHNALADTCVAMDEWLLNPMANSALEDIIPRVNEEVAQGILKGAKGVTYALTNMTNTAIVNIYNVNMPPKAGPLYVNQSGPLVPVLCNPFNLDFTDRQCETDEVKFKNATEVWRKYMCQVSASGICTTPGRLTPDVYNQMTTSLNISYGLYNYGPFLVDLVDSTYLKETFSVFSKNYCASLRKSTYWMYAGFTMVSIAVMFSLILWVVYARERRHQKYFKKHINRANENPFGGGKSW